MYQYSQQLVNYYRGSGALTLKSSMIRTLRAYLREKQLDQEHAGVPLTFVVYPKRLQESSVEENADENTGALAGACKALTL